jgi:hypothetical protein
MTVKRAEERLGLCSCGFGRQVERGSLYNAEPTRIIGNEGSIRAGKGGSLTATGSISGRATAALFRHRPRFRDNVLTMARRSLAHNFQAVWYRAAIMALCWPATPSEVKFAADSPLEGDGFELPVPRCARIADSAALVISPDSAVSGEFRQIAARYLDWSPCSNDVAAPAGGSISSGRILEIVAYLARN